MIGSNMIKILIVDDSAVVRKVLSDELSKARGIEVVGTAVDPYVARDKIVRLKPDVITLDLEMPRMDGLTFLRKLMKYYPMPVLVISSLTPKGSDTALKALELGAVDVVCKPGSAFSVAEISKMLVEKIRAAAVAQIKPPASRGRVESITCPGNALQYTSHGVLAIGASTGGTRAIEDILVALPNNTPGTIIVQHMPEHFTATFAKRLNSLSRMEVREAVNNDLVVPGVALIAPGGRHMVLRRSGARYCVSIKMGPPVHHQRPSVDVLFHSVATQAGSNALGVILTGMGSDGAEGLGAMKKAGARTIAQDQASCVVFGMPKEAIDAGAVEATLPLVDIPQRIVDLMSKRNANPGRPVLAQNY